MERGVGVVAQEIAKYWCRENVYVHGERFMLSLWLAGHQQEGHFRFVP